MADKVKRGWGWPLNSKKAHYFVGGMSLCRRMMYLGNNLEEGNDDSSDNCAECKRINQRRKNGRSTSRS